VGNWRTVGRIVAAVAMAAAAVATAVTGVGGSAPAGAQVVDPFGEFTPVTPARILDTRSGLGQSAPGPVGADQTIDVQVSGRGGVPATGASAVVLNVTAVSPTAGGYLTVYPTGASRPTISNVNFTPGSVVPNMTTVVLGTGGSLSVYNPAGSTHVLFDVVGYYADSTGPAGARFTSVGPYRRFDTRNNWGFVGTQPIGPGQTLSVDMSTGDSPVPASGVTAVVMNVTVTAPTAAGYLRVTPAGGTSTTSSLNFVPGQTVPNLVTVPVSPSGVVDFYNPAGSTHVIADIVGYYGGPVVGEAGRFIPIAPVRAYDTRLSPEGPIPPGWTLGLNLGPFGADAAVINVTVTQPTEAGFLTVFDDDLCEIPLASNLNFTAGQTVANQAITGLSTPGPCAVFPEIAPAAAFYNPVGWTHVVVDLFGVFTNATLSAATLGADAPLSGAADSGAGQAEAVLAPASGRDTAG
jgi:hypothetical protein